MIILHLSLLSVNRLVVLNSKVVDKVTVQCSLPLHLLENCFIKRQTERKSIESIIKKTLKPINCKKKKIRLKKVQQNLVRDSTIYSTF